MENFIPHVHARIRQARLTRRGATMVPEDVPRGGHKSYPRMEQFLLPEPRPLSVSISDVLHERASYEHGSMEQVIPRETWGTLLGHSLKKREHSTKRPFPSGGGLYPVETYLFGAIDQSSLPAVFHYEPSAHALEKLWDLPKQFSIKELYRVPETLYFSAFLVFTSVWQRSSAKYGELAYSHGLVEAGHMSQNILLVATALGLESRPIAGFNDELIIRELDLDPEEEQPVHCIALSAAVPPLSD